MAAWYRETSVWLREIAGWVLIGAGLAAFAVCYFVFLLNKRVVEGAGLMFIGFTVFRGGMHLLKVALAARAAADVVKPAISVKSTTAARRVNRPVVEHGRPPATVIPGADPRAIRGPGS